MTLQTVAAGKARLVGATGIAVFTAALAADDARAHLMPAQRGTLNIVAGEGGATAAYMVLSLPVSALHAVDDDGDGLLSHVELQRHAAHIEQQLRAQVQLVGSQGALPLQGVMLHLSPPDETPAAPAPQLVMLGRFALGAPSDALKLRIALQGRHLNEQRFDVFVSRQTSAGPAGQVLAQPPAAPAATHTAAQFAAPTQRLVIDRTRPTQALFPTLWQRLAQRVQAWLGWV